MNILIGVLTMIVCLLLQAVLATQVLSYLAPWIPAQVLQIQSSVMAVVQ